MILVKILIFLILMLIISHVYKTLSDKNNKKEEIEIEGFREGFREGNTSNELKKKIPTKKETDEVTQTAEKALSSLQIPQPQQDAILKKIKEFNLNGDMSDLQSKLGQLLTLSENSKKINEGLEQRR